MQKHLLGPEEAVEHEASGQVFYYLPRDPEDNAKKQM